MARWGGRGLPDQAIFHLSSVIFKLAICEKVVSNMWLEDPARVGVSFEVAEYARKGNT